MSRNRHGECAAALRLTPKGYVRNQWPLSEVCAPLNRDRKCKRPRGVWHLYFKLTAGLVMGRQVLGSLFIQPKLIWIESYSLSHPPTRLALEKAKENDFLVMTVLRHPIDRIVAHFLAASPAKTPFADWVEMNSRPPPRRGNDGKFKFWLELENIYAKVLSGCCNKSYTTPSLHDAQETLYARFDLVLVAEWLDHPATIAYLADNWLCFPHNDGIISSPRPSFSRTRRYRNPVDEARRNTLFSTSTNASTFATAHASIFQDLTSRNNLDLFLYYEAAKRHRAAVETYWGSPVIFASLPCTPNAACWDLSIPDTVPPTDFLSVHNKPKK